MKRSLLLGAIIALLIAIPVFAANWVQIDEKMYLDASSLDVYNYGLNYNNHRIYSIWAKVLNNGNEIWKSREKQSSKKLWYDKVLYITNCSNRQIAIKSILTYDIKENLVEFDESNYIEWTSVAPETTGELVYTLVCKSNTVNDIQSNYSQNNTIINPDGTKIKIRKHR